MAPLLVLLCTGFSAARCASAFGADDRASVHFSRDIRPILSNNCFKCHGPDGAERQSGLRLDVRDASLQPAESGKAAIVPGKPSESELVRRIFADDDERMPPPDSGKKLSQQEKSLLENWIAQGAEYQAHWSFIAPRRPPLTVLENTAWPRNAIDGMILARLVAEGLAPSPEADRTTLIRRLTLDLTGLPPTPAEVDRFLADQAPDAYERLVERLLESPRYGERMALEWLDAARFADTHGFHIDSGRDMTRWRRWVIDAYNQNLPFDRFTVEQLAGDLLPGATREQQVASGFNRNHMINFEGGAIPEEYLTAYIIDRVNTTATVWLGLTIACTQCHDHKYDPISQKEFYQLYAFFNNVPENGLDGSKGNAAPLIKAPSRAEQQELDELDSAIAELTKRLAEPLPEVDAAQAEWEQIALAEEPVHWLTLDPDELNSQGGATLKRLDDKSILATGENPATETYSVTATVNLPEITAIRLEALPDDSLAAKGPGRSPNGNLVLTEVRLAAGSPLEPGAMAPVPLTTASADFSQQDYPVAHAIDQKPATGWAIYPEVGKPHAAVFQAAQPVAARERDASEGIRVSMVLEFQSAFGQHQAGRFRLSATGAKDPHGANKLPAAVLDALASARENRSIQQHAAVREYFRSHYSPVTRPQFEELGQLVKQRQDLENSVGTTMVMQEMDQPRETFLLVRGQYDKRGEKVTAGVPASLPPLPADAPANRMGLARWLVDPAHPLTARVIVNRYWQMYFGTGIVKTSEDFGLQGQFPSHPELLDWLATEFVASGWDVKHIQRLIVTSATYRQSSSVTAELAAGDPENRLLARGPRIRLAAEFIRDQALAASGLLSTRIGGKSVSPYQPPGLWEELMSRADGANWTAQTYVQDHGEDLYQRTMYTFWKRTCPPATLSTFDAPDRETCTVRRARTNTPLQALVLMNDPTYVEAARKLAERLLTEAGPTPEERIALAFRLLVARAPRSEELSVLKGILDEQWAAFRDDNTAAFQLLGVGESPPNNDFDAAELAAWTMVASVLLNLDETVTKG